MTINDMELTALIAREARRYFPELYEETDTSSIHPAWMPEEIEAAADSIQAMSSVGVTMNSTRLSGAILSPAPVVDTLPFWNGFETSPLISPNLSGQSTLSACDIEILRDDFPILQETVNGHPLIWFDNGATTQKPSCVIERLRTYYLHENSNIHRAAHTLARAATSSYEGARRQLAALIGAPSPEEIIFVRGATEAINLVAATYGEIAIEAGDEILVSGLEHHANIVPWQLLCRKTGAVLRSIPLCDDGQLDMAAYQKLLCARTKIVAVAQVSNVLGTTAPIGEMTQLAHRAGAVLLVDGAQAVSHMPVDVTALDCDFYAFSGHKMFGPTGIGVLYGKMSLLEAMPPYQGGGNMIDIVTLEESRFKKPPHRFEAGTGNIADAVALGEAASYLTGIGMSRIQAYEQGLVHYALEQLRQLPGIRIVGTSEQKAGLISFEIAGQDSDRLAAQLDKAGIAVRSGHHCAQPVLLRFGLDKAVRASFAVYNTTEEIDRFVQALDQVIGP